MALSNVGGKVSSFYRNVVKGPVISPFDCKGLKTRWEKNPERFPISVYIEDENELIRKLLTCMEIEIPPRSNIWSLRCLFLDNLHPQAKSSHALLHVSFMRCFMDHYHDDFLDSNSVCDMMRLEKMKIDAVVDRLSMNSVNDVDRYNQERHILTPLEREEFELHLGYIHKGDGVVEMSFQDDVDFLDDCPTLSTEEC